jgi:D-alanine-D-alanine ligase and related ATP-grasp enzymes
MTSHSLVPKAAAAAGIDYQELCWRVLETSFGRERGTGNGERGTSRSSGATDPASDDPPMSPTASSPDSPRFPLPVPRSRDSEGGAT